MGKAVAVLTGTEGVSGTVYFTQEGDGNLNIYVHFAYNNISYSENSDNRLVIW